MDFLATAAFGLEGLARRELNHLGLEAKGETGGARFTATPAQAFANGSTHVVIGRPITQAPDPAAAFDSIVAEID